MTARTRTTSQGASPEPLPEARGQVLPRRIHSDRSRDVYAGAALLDGRDQSRDRPPGHPRGRDREWACRSVPVRRPSLRELPPTGEPPKRSTGARHAVLEFDDNSLGVRFLSASTAWAIVVPVCLPDTIRSQGFSPSQRFDPARALWLCFAPHPPLGFLVASRAFPSRSAGTPLGARCSLAVSASFSLTRASSRSAFAPASECSIQPHVCRTIPSCWSA
jgi:hypothetical protein